jgi:rod shape-determining protein MreC
MTLANNVTGKIHQQYNNINGFFKLRKTADSLMKRNAELLNNKNTNLLPTDTSIKEIADYIPIDTLGNIKKIVHFVYRPAAVIYNNTTNDDKKNLIVLARGKNDGIGVDMAVLGAESNAVVGKIVYADAKYSYVMSLLHLQSSVPAKIKRTSDNGTINWDGNNSRIVLMKKVPKTSELKLGDTIMTNNSSDIFPENLYIGTIQDFKEDKATSNYIIKVKTAANFNLLNYVNVIENVQQKEIRESLKTLQKIQNNKQK